MPIRRTLKNVVRNYTDAQVKVREATSNDPWGPSSTLMSEIADLTYNVMAFTEIMQMIWKRLNDHGKNWRHVYKAMVLLDYIVKTGSEKVAQQCKENIYTIQTLKDFQYVEENKDMGLNVREKAKQLVALLKDDERLKNERAKALKAKERFAQSTVVSMYQRGATSPTSEGYSDQLASDANYMPRSDSAPTTLNPDANPEIEAVRPSTVGEEELQLQLALAMSKEEHDEDQRKRVRDDAKLQMAIEESRKEKETKERLQAQAALQSPPPPSNKETLLEILGGQGGAAAAPATDPWGAPVATNDPWNASSGAGATATAPSHSPAANDPWSGGSATQTSAAASSSASTTTSTTQPANGQAAQSSDPWAPKPAAGGATAPAAANDPWGAPPAQTNGNTSTQQVGAGLDEAFDMIGSRSKSPSNTASAGGAGSGGAFDMMPMGQTLEPMSIYENAGSLASTEKTPESFLGANAGLVNLDNLVTKPTTPGAGPFQDSNPFGASGSSGSSAPVNNPFGPVSQASRVPLNQMATSNSPSNMMMASGAPPPAMGAMGTMPPPMGAMPPMSVPQPGMMGAAPPMMMGGMPPPMMMGGMPPPQTGFGGTMPMMPAGGAGVMASSPMMPMGNGSTATAGGAPASNPFL